MIDPRILAEEIEAIVKSNSLDSIDKAKALVDAVPAILKALRVEATRDGDALLREFIDGPRNDPINFNEREWLARVVKYLEWSKRATST